MPLPIVAIEVSPPEPPSGAVVALLQACDEAFPRGECLIADSGSDTDKVERWVRLQWIGDNLLAAHVEVRVPGQNDPQSVRDLAFTSTDSVLERWRSAGLVAGTLADESLSSQPRSPEPQHLSPSGSGVRAATAPEMRPEGRKSPSPRRRRATWIDGALTAGPTLSRWQVGGTVRAGHEIAGPLFVLFAVRYDQRLADPSGVSIRWLTPSIGVGALLAPGAGLIEVNPRLELLGELAQASVTDASTGNTDAKGRFTPGFRIGVDVTLGLTDWSRAMIGGDISYTGRPIDIRVHGDRVGTLSSSAGMFLVGWRANFH